MSRTQPREHYRHTLVSLRASPRDAFACGFWKGLGAPVVLFGTHELPEEAAVQLQSIPDRDFGSLDDDWKAVGEDLSKAISLGY